MKPLAIAAACLGLALLSFFQFPGHTWLQQDSQIYAPILEQLRDPSLFRNDIVVSKHHVSFTFYDETAVALQAASGLDFGIVLGALQVATRAFGIWGLYLIVLSIAKSWSAKSTPSGPLAFLVAAICALGAVVTGPAVLTVEYEPTPRALALPLVLCAIGLLANRRQLAAGIAAGAAFALHPPTAAPFWVLFALVALWPREMRGFRSIALAFIPLAAALALLLISSRFEQVGEKFQLFGVLSPALEQLQRMRASYNWISTWPASVVFHYCVLFGLLVGAFARLRRDIGFELRAYILGLATLGMLSMPLSWLLLDHWRLALLPQLQPMRLLLFVTLFAQLLSAVAGIKAVIRGRAIEGACWLAAAYLITVQPVLTERYAPRPALMAIALAVMTSAAVYLGRRSQAALLAAPAAALIAFFAIPAAGVENYPALHNPELRQVSDWARSSTPRDAVFLFVGAPRSLDAGIFRCEAQRAIYVDWKSGGQVNYFPEFAAQWSFRWKQTLAQPFDPAAFPRYEGLGIDYVVAQGNKRPASPPAFENGKYAVFALKRQM